MTDDLIQCTGCQSWKPKSEFWKNSGTKCKQCMSAAYKKWRLRNLEHNRLRMRKYRKENKTRCAEISRRNYANNGHKWKTRALEYRKETRPRRREQQRIHALGKRHANIEYRLRINLRNRIRKAVQSGQKTGSAVRDLGCSIPEFKRHLEAQFAPGMSWENYGYGPGKWNIDHIQELCLFDLTDRSQFLRAAHYTNMRPLWHEENLGRNKGIQTRKKKWKNMSETTLGTKSETPNSEPTRPT